MSQTVSAAAQCPTLRGDLVVSRQSANGTVNFVVKDPATGRFFRFRETEGFILQQLDGGTSLPVVRARVEGTFGATLSLSNLEGFVARLRALGLLADEGSARVLAPPPSGRIRGDALYLRLKAFDPDRVFDRLVGRLSFFFTPHFVTFSAALVLFAVGLTIANWGEITQDIQRLYSVQSLLIVWATVFLVIVAHECAHGLTCKHYGASVREIGFFFLYFQPAFYCNVSDAWLFPEKSKRLWVTFAGAYFETFLWALATLVWWLTDTHSTVNHLALVVVATSAIKSFFNMNPLIKLDGYYLLSDWLGIPNLRQKAFGYVGSRIKRLWATANTPLSDITARERRIFPIYALLAGGYSYWLFGKILLWFGSYMVWRYQGLGFVLFAAALGFLFRRPIGKALAPLKSRLQPGLGRRIMAVSKRTRLGLGLGLFLAVLFFGRMELKVSGPFTVLPLHNADVRAEVEGIIEQIYADEGDFVNQGALIARLSDRDYSAELRKTRAEIEAREAQLKLLKAGPRPEEIELARTLVAKAEERLAFGRGHLERDRLLVDQKLISENEFEETKEMVAVRVKELTEANERLKVLLPGAWPEEIESLEAEIRRLSAHERYLQDQLKSLTVNSPIAGVVTTHKLKEKIGENGKKGDLIAKVHALKTVTVEIAVPEKEIADIKIGRKVVLKARAYPGRTFEGEVNAIAPIANMQTDWQPERTVLVTTKLDNTAGLLKPEMTGNAKIYCGRQRLLDLVTRRFVRFIRVEFWSWW